MIVIVVALLLVRHGWYWDGEQVHLHGMTGGGLRLGLVLALFSFVGFESATTLGSEPRNPLQTIPRAVIQSAILAGAFRNPSLTQRRASRPIMRFRPTWKSA